MHAYSHCKAHNTLTLTLTLITFKFIITLITIKIKLELQYKIRFKKVCFKLVESSGVSHLCGFSSPLEGKLFKSDSDM